MNGFLENAQRILDTAVESERAGLGGCDWTIFFGPDGGLEMIAGTENTLDSLTWSRGARAAWQVTHRDGTVRVDGRSEQGRCRLESARPDQAARMLLGSTRMYQLAAA